MKKGYVSVPVMFFILMASGFLTPPAFACSCVAEWGIEDDYIEVESIIFSGKVASIKEQQITFLVTFEIDQAWKGIPNNVSNINVMTPQGSASCGYDFVEQQEYLVVAQGKWDQTPSVSICGSTTPLGIAQEQVSFLNKNTEPKTMDDMISPLKQMESGVPASDVKCNEGLELILKASDGSAKCVSPSTASVLIQRGWATQAI